MMSGLHILKNSPQRKENINLSVMLFVKLYYSNIRFLQKRLVSFQNHGGYTKSVATPNVVSWQGP